MLRCLLREKVDDMGQCHFSWRECLRNLLKKMYKPGLLKGPSDEVDQNSNQVICYVPTVVKMESSKSKEVCMILRMYSAIHIYCIWLAEIRGDNRMLPWKPWKNHPNLFCCTSCCANKSRYQSCKQEKLGE